MRKYWILAAALIVAISTSACESKAPAEEPKQQAQETARQEVETSDPDIMIPDFTSGDLSGNEVTNEFFADSKITLVNVWTTT